jgi:hypothetical protein
MCLLHFGTTEVVIELRLTKTEGRAEYGTFFANNIEIQNHESSLSMRITKAELPLNGCLSKE